MKDNTIHAVILFPVALLICTFFVCFGACQQESANVNDEVPVRETDEDGGITPSGPGDDDSNNDDDDSTDDDSTDDDDTTTDDDDATTDDDDDSADDYPKDHDTVWDCYLCHESPHYNTYAAPDDCLGCHSKGNNPSDPRWGLPTWHLLSGNCAQCHGPFKHNKPFTNEMCLICHSKQYTPK